MLKKQKMRLLSRSQPTRFTLHSLSNSSLASLRFNDLPISTKGVIILKYDDTYYVVEFFDSNSNTIGTYVVSITKARQTLIEISWLITKIVHFYVAESVHKCLIIYTYNFG